MSRLAPTMQAFFTDRLIRERNASPNTIAAYRDTMRLLLSFAADRLSIEPSRIEIGDLDARLIGAFLEHLERDRGCGPKTRNTRLTAIRSLPLRRPSAPRARGDDRAGARDPTKTPR